MIYDKDIREPLFDYLEEYFGKTRVIEEKTIGRSRADVFLVLPDCICGLEIKSDADSYTRLASQVKDYDRFFDENIVVVGTSHALHVKEHVPEHWGIITVEELENGLDFYMLRKPERHTKVTWERKLGILWRPEIAMLLETFDLPKYARMSKADVVKKITAAIGTKIPEERLYEEYSRLLFERDYQKIAEVIQEYKAQKGYDKKTTEPRTRAYRKVAKRRKRAARKKA